MPKRTLFQNLIVTAKGLAMGAADVVPGVSGGTIAFISGIYEELIETIHKLDFGFFKIAKKEGLKRAWETYNLSFLLFLFLGVLISILSLAKIILSLLENYPIQVWAFFFGLVVASIVYVGKQIDRWKIQEIVGLIIATAFSYYITIAEPIGTPDSLLFLFFAGFIAIIAMILPGLSGAFVLLLLGAYTNVMGIITDFVEGLIQMDASLLKSSLLKIAIFGLGAILGLKIFSRSLNWMFKHHKSLTLALLTGLMVGALNKIWPWKRVLEYRINSSGESVPYLEKSILPSYYDGQPLILYAIIFAIFGFIIIFLLEFFASKKSTSD